MKREIEDIAVGIICRDAGEGARRGPLDPVRLRILAAQQLENARYVFHLDTEMVEPSRTACLARIDIEANVSVTHRDGAHGALEQLRRLHAEHGLVEVGQQRILLADDRDVIDLGEHAVISPVI